MLLKIFLILVVANSAIKRGYWFGKISGKPTVAS